jgi:ketosteroid isomerase-like protein
MSSDIQALQGIYGAFNRRDIDGLLAGFDPEIVIEQTEDLAYAAALLRVLGPRFVILSGGYRGHPEVRRLFETVWEISDWFQVEPLEFIEAGERIVVPLQLRARAKDTGLEGEAETAHLWTMRDSKATRLEVYASKGDAVAAAGPS